jgi:hypothetical protein
MVKRLLVSAAVMAMGVALAAQAPAARPLSGRGQASTQVGGDWVKGERTTYQGGKWIDVTYGRPVLRQRTNIFGTGADYGKALYAGAPLAASGSAARRRRHASSQPRMGPSLLSNNDVSPESGTPSAVAHRRRKKTV